MRNANAHGVVSNSLNDRRSHPSPHRNDSNSRTHLPPSHDDMQTVSPKSSPRSTARTPPASSPPSSILQAEILPLTTSHPTTTTQLLRPRQAPSTPPSQTAPKSIPSESKSTSLDPLCHVPSPPSASHPHEQTPHTQYIRRTLTHPPTHPPPQPRPRISPQAIPLSPYTGSQTPLISRRFPSSTSPLTPPTNHTQPR